MHSINLFLFERINGLALINPRWDIFFIILTTSFSTALFILVMIYVFFHQHAQNKSITDTIKKYKEVLIVVLTICMTFTIVQSIKVLLAIPRPFLTLADTRSLITYGGNNSFPSMHAALFTALAASIFYSHRTLSSIIGVLAFLIGFSRIYVGVHYPIDVVAGFAIGIGVAWIVRVFLKR